MEKGKGQGQFAPYRMGKREKRSSSLKGRGTGCKKPPFRGKKKGMPGTPLFPGLKGGRKEAGLAGGELLAALRGEKKRIAAIFFHASRKKSSRAILRRPMPLKKKEKDQAIARPKPLVMHAAAAEEKKRNRLAASRGEGGRGPLSSPSLRTAGRGGKKTPDRTFALRKREECVQRYEFSV